MEGNHFAAVLQSVPVSVNCVVVKYMYWPVVRAHGVWTRWIVDVGTESDPECWDEIAR